MTKTVAEVVKEYLETKNKTEQYSEVIILCEGVHYKFEHVSSIKNLTNYTFVAEQTYRITHYSMFLGHITDKETDITGRILSMTKNVGKREYIGD